MAELQRLERQESTCSGDLSSGADGEEPSERVVRRRRSLSGGGFFGILNTCSFAIFIDSLQILRALIYRVYTAIVYGGCAAVQTIRTVKDRVHTMV